MCGVEEGEQARVGGDIRPAQPAAPLGERLPDTAEGGGDGDGLERGEVWRVIGMDGGRREAAVYQHGAACGYEGGEDAPAA